jgi:hypothetical protein
MKECCRNSNITKSKDSNTIANVLEKLEKIVQPTVGICLLIEEITRLWVTKTLMEGLRPPCNS